MKLLKACVTNFGSYKNLELDFSTPGMILIQGPTGSGKSTLADIPCWILYGQTAKGGNADEVRSWNSDTPTTGTLVLTVKSSIFTITRVRGASSSKNDLYWQEGPSSEKHRGKSISETQVLLSDRLGVNLELYTTAAYFTEFGPSSHFFTADAKYRRSVFEKIASLEFPTSLTNKIAEAKKTHKPLLDTAVKDVYRWEEKVIACGSNLEESSRASEAWEVGKSNRIEILKQKISGFDREKETQIAACQTKHDREETAKSEELIRLSQKATSLKNKIKPASYFDSQYELIKKEHACPSCGGISSIADYKLKSLEKKIIENAKYEQSLEQVLESLERRSTSINPHTVSLEHAKALENPYGTNLEWERSTKNPYSSRLSKLSSELVCIQEEYSKALHSQNTANTRMDRLNSLSDLVSQMKVCLLSNSIASVEASTNSYLEKHFDSELRVSFALDGPDNLTVGISKSGNSCVYKQLSKGQRSLLRLCFVVSVMKHAANNAGLHFDTLWFDEALDGLDSDLKIKAFSLFDRLSLEHANIMLIDHAPEFQNLFSNRWHVSIDSDCSHLERNDA